MFRRRCITCDVRTVDALHAHDFGRVGARIACCSSCQADVDRLLLAAAFARAIWRRVS